MRQRPLAPTPLTLTPTILHSLGYPPRGGSHAAKPVAAVRGVRRVRLHGGPQQPLTFPLLQGLTCMEKNIGHRILTEQNR